MPPWCPGRAVYGNSLLRGLILYTFGGLEHPTAILARTYIHPQTSTSLYSDNAIAACLAYYRRRGVDRDDSDMIVFWPAPFWQWPSCPTDANGYASQKGVRHAWAKCGVGFSIEDSVDTLLSIAREHRGPDDQPDVGWSKARIVRHLLSDGLACIGQDSNLRTRGTGA